MRAPRSALRGPQLAGWTPAVPPKPRYRVRTEPDVAIPLADGTVLVGDVYRPDTDQPQPALLGWSPYNKDLMPTGVPAPFNEPGDVTYLAGCGYPVAVVNARGTGRSGGELPAEMFGPGEVDDLGATIAWLASQPWCDGRVAMTGMSYFAISQLVAAGHRIPHLAAIAPFGAATDLYRMMIYHNGTLTSGFLGRYVAINGAAQRARLRPAVRHALGHVVGTRPAQAAIRTAMARALPRLTRRLPVPEPWLRRWAAYALDAPFDGPLYRDASAWPRLGDIDVPVLIGSEWSMVGLHLFGAFDAWHAVTAPKRMFIGPRWSRWPFLRYQQEIAAYYDHVLRGVDNGYDALPPIRYWLHGAERWESAEDWPVPDARPWRLHLTGEELSGSAAAADERWWAAIPPGMEYPGAFDGHHVLRYRTAPLPVHAHLAGPAHLTLRMTSTAMDTHVQVRLSDVAPDGTATVISVGWLPASHRAEDERRSTPTEIVHDHTRPTALTPGEPVTLRMSLAPFAQLVRAGHRLQLEIGSDPVRLAPPASDYVYFGMAGPPYAARNTVLHGSRLELSVRGELPW
ncbi:CocE/NonD family hydrolase [Nonomuraea insulae]|uniref:CocE/NonD family hydrolase n=1 Tax=Nonomuraea insulae TaxID=1616787 RepID=A0ABW1CTU9_9ACTN